MTKCTYKLKAILEEEYEIDDGERAADNIKKDETRLYSFKVPKDSEITSRTVRLHLGTVNATSVKMFVVPNKNKNSASSTPNTLEVIP